MYAHVMQWHGPYASIQTVIALNREVYQYTSSMSVGVEGSDIQSTSWQSTEPWKLNQEGFNTCTLPILQAIHKAVSNDATLQEWKAKSVSGNVEDIEKRRDDALRVLADSGCWIEYTYQHGDTHYHNVLEPIDDDSDDDEDE